MPHTARKHAPIAEPSSPASDDAMRRVHEVLDRVFGAPAERTFDIRLWDGSVYGAATADVHSDFCIVFNRRGALRRMLLPPSELAIAEALVSGDVEVEGNLESAMGLADVMGARINTLRGVAALLPRIIALPRDEDAAPDLDPVRYSRSGGAATAGAGAARRSAEKEIRFHYDVGNDFYALWLDDRMLYTCAYYNEADDSLARAQEAKLDHICRKLRLLPGERLLDIGCGWGGLVMHAAEHYGVQAQGITLSAAQAEWAQQRIAQKGLSDRCRVDAVDFRDLPADARFDKMSSVGVTEHVPEDQQPAYFARAFAALEPGGLFLNHCETSNLAARSRNTIGERFGNWLWRRDQFIHRYVFPDARLVALGSIITSAEKAGFETRDVESLREHYTLTLRAWLRNLEGRKEEAIALVGERTYRVWRLYMSVSAYGFDHGAINIVQTLLSKPTTAGRSGLPLTRDDLYAR